MNHSSARQAGFSFPGLPIGPMNGITDVAGVQVGHSTLIEGEQIRTGVTCHYSSYRKSVYEKDHCQLFCAQWLRKNNWPCTSRRTWCY
nr:P1 family peptidase [Shouchella lehensis]